MRRKFEWWLDHGSWICDFHFAGQGNAGPRNSEHSLRSRHETGKDLNCLVTLFSRLAEQMQNRRWLQLCVVVIIHFVTIFRCWLTSKRIPSLLRNTRRTQWWWARFRSLSKLELSRWDRFEWKKAVKWAKLSFLFFWTFSPVNCNFQCEFEWARW